MMLAPSWEEPAGSGASRVHLSPTDTGFVGKVAGMRDGERGAAFSPFCGASGGMLRDPSGAISNRVRCPCICRWLTGAIPLAAWSPLVTNTESVIATIVVEAV